MEYKWIAQDYDGRIDMYITKPVHDTHGWIAIDYENIVKGSSGMRPKNWRDSIIDLETHDYKIEDGILMKVEKELRIQYKHKDLNEWKDLIMPECEYRLKPKTKVVRFRNYLYKGQVMVAYQGSGDIEWIGDWQEVEVPNE